MRVGLTALGMACALGKDHRTILERAWAGDASSMRPWEGVLPDGATSPFGRVDLDEPSGPCPPRCARLLEIALGQMTAALDALFGRVPKERIGIVLGSSNSTMEEYTRHPPEGIDMATPATWLKERLGVAGPAWVVSTACSSSAKAFASARRLLAGGVCEAVIVGGVDSFSRVVENGFFALEALSPILAQPMGKHRAGINLGEGAALFIMERAGGPVDLLGVGESSDAYHLTAPHPEGRGAADAMRAALADAGLSLGEVDYINLHGTGTVYNDRMESLAIREVFGLTVPCSSTKPLTGHTLGAAGAIEAGLCWLMLRAGDRLLPHRFDGVRDETLPPIPLVGLNERRPCRIALSNSFAFGGSNASLILGRNDHG
ncbi:MAG: beta-ketoacyl-[acyl-carrier-protein] synthase II [Kiritimatiellae bacterium]|nr:beta-ketoacyl-[acyl-carrier-protein] synthase II [Kiritimatiellia bacterium]